MDEIFTTHKLRAPTFNGGVNNAYVASIDGRWTYCGQWRVAGPPTSPPMMGEEPFLEAFGSANCLKHFFLDEGLFHEHAVEN